MIGRVYGVMEVVGRLDGNSARKQRLILRCPEGHQIVKWSHSLARWPGECPECRYGIDRLDPARARLALKNVQFARFLTAIYVRRAALMGYLRHPSDIESSAMFGLIVAAATYPHRGRHSFRKWARFKIKKSIFRQFAATTTRERHFKNVPEQPIVVDSETFIAAVDSALDTRDLLTGLTAQEATILRMYAIEDYSFEQIAAQTGLSRCTVGRRYHDAVERLKVRLALRAD